MLELTSQFSECTFSTTRGHYKVFKHQVATSQLIFLMQNSAKGMPYHLIFIIVAPHI